MRPARPAASTVERRSGAIPDRQARCFFRSVMSVLLRDTTRGIPWLLRRRGALVPAPFGMHRFVRLAVLTTLASLALASGAQAQRSRQPKKKPFSAFSESAQRLKDSLSIRLNPSTSESSTPPVLMALSTFDENALRDSVLIGCPFADRDALSSGCRVAGQGVRLQRADSLRDVGAPPGPPAHGT